MQLHVQYLTDDSGAKTAVQIPFSEWRKFVADYNHLRQCKKLKASLETAFREVDDIRKGKVKPVTLDEFLNEI